MNRFIAIFSLVISLLVPNVSFAQTIGDIDPVGVSSEACVSLSVNIRYRMNDRETGGQVTQLQDFLQNNGYLASEPTGFFGLQTLTAVKKLQVEKGLLNSGYVGPLTRASISCVNVNRSVAPSTTSTTPIPSGNSTQVEALRKKIDDLLSTVNTLQTQIKTTQSVAPASAVVNQVQNTTTIATSSILVTSLSSPQSWWPGILYPITWNSNRVSSVDIFLYKDGVYEQRIANCIANIGSYSWTPVTIVAGAHYTIRVMDCTNQSLYDDTDSYFYGATVVPPQGQTVTLNPSSDNFFQITNGSMTFGDLVNSSFAVSPTPGVRTNEIFIFRTTPPDPLDSSSGTYYLMNYQGTGNAFYKVGNGLNQVNSDVIPGYFIVRNNTVSSQTITLPTDVKFWGSFMKDTLPRPWDLGALTVGVGSIPQTSTITPGQTVVFASYTFDASKSLEDVRVNSVPLKLAIFSGSGTNLDNCILYNGTTPVNSGSWIVAPWNPANLNLIHFQLNNGFVVPKGSQAILTLKCDVRNIAVGAYRWGISAGAQVDATIAKTGQRFPVTIVAGDAGLQTIAPVSQPQGQTVTLNPSSDNFFKIKNGSMIFSQLTSMGLVTSPSPGSRTEEVLTFTNNPPTSLESASGTYYQMDYQGTGIKFYKFGSGLTDFSLDQVPSYFIIRNNATTSQTFTVIPSLLEFFGSTVQNPSVRPW